MAADSTRPRDEQPPRHDADRVAEGRAAGDGGETLAEKIRRYRQPAPGARAGVSGGVVVRSPREE